jgi:hypothetical protein
MPFVPPPPRPFYQQVDESEIQIDGVSLKLNRSSTLRLPFEVSLVIPRAEIHRRYYEGGEVVREEEVKLSGITLVHSPRFPPRRGAPAGKPALPPAPPAAPEPLRPAGEARAAVAAPAPGQPPRVSFLFPLRSGREGGEGGRNGCGEGGSGVK